MIVHRIRLSRDAIAIDRPQLSSRRTSGIQVRITGTRCHAKDNMTTSPAAATANQGKLPMNQRVVRNNQTVFARISASMNTSNVPAETYTHTHTHTRLTGHSPTRQTRVGRQGAPTCVSWVSKRRSCPLRQTGVDDAYLVQTIRILFSNAHLLTTLSVVALCVCPCVLSCRQASYAPRLRACCCCCY